MTAQYGWRAWTITTTATSGGTSGPVLGSPFHSTFITTGPTILACCGWGIPHDAPDPECECGIYAMTNRADLPLWCYPAEVVTRLALHGPVLPGLQDMAQGAFPGEVRAAGATIVGPCYISPHKAHHAQALAERYGTGFKPDPALAAQPSALTSALSLLRPTKRRTA